MNALLASGLLLLSLANTDPIASGALGGAIPMRRAVAVRAAETIHVDGRPNETVWGRAPITSDFREREPGLGDKPPVKTTVQVAYDENALYFFVVAETEGPDDIVVRTLRRDSYSIFSDDSIAIKIDPHHDRRTGLTFAANADGAQFEAMTLEDGRVGIRAWDAVWEVESQRTPTGFSLEFRIPFAVLGIKGGDAVEMGLDITRDHSRRNATYDWRLIVPPRHPVSASSFGILEGLTNIEAKRALEIVPYFAARTDFSHSFSIDPRRSQNLALGGDLRLQVGRGSYVEGTVLTDFAQVEADEVQVARDRFPLFFPERRPFFLNGLDVFNFGQPKTAQLFFSRRIGLDAGRPVAIGGGAKAYGRVGPIAYGFLNVQTLRSLPAGNDPDGIRVSPHNVTVARLRAQAGPHLTVGVIGLGRHVLQASDEDAFSGGLDVELRSVDGKWRNYAFVASSWYRTPKTETSHASPTKIEDLGHGAGEELGASASNAFEYQGLYVRPKLSWLWSDSDFQAPLGFYRRPGTAEQRAEIDFVPRPKILGLREIAFGPRVVVTTDPGYNDLLTTSYGANLSIRFRNGWGAKYENRYRIDDIQNPFELYRYSIDASRYSGARNQIEVSSPRRLWISASAHYQVQDLFGGRTHQGRAGLQLKLTKHFSLSGTYTQRFGHLRDPDDHFNFGFANGKLDVAFTRALLWDTMIRYNVAPGTESLGLQSRLRWRYRPGSDIFLVYRTEQALAPALDGETPKAFHELTLKATFYLRSLLPG